MKDIYLWLCGINQKRRGSDYHLFQGLQDWLEVGRNLSSGQTPVLNAFISRLHQRHPNDVKWWRRVMTKWLID